MSEDTAPSRPPQRLEDGPVTRVQDDVYAERARAHVKHSTDPHGSMEEKPWDHPIWTPVLVEEVGEVARVICEEELGNESDVRRRLREELVQVAAMAEAWVAALDAGDEDRRWDADV